MATRAMEHRFNNLLLLLCLTSVFISGSDAGDDVCSGDVQTSKRLKKDLLCGYDKTQGPTRLRSNKTNVQFKIFLLHFTLYDDYTFLELHCHIDWLWRDDFLTWEPEQYNGLKEVSIPSSEIWGPEVFHYTSHYTSAMKANIASPSEFSQLSSNGDVLTLSAETYYATCNLDLTRWPFDSQNCSIQIGSWWLSKEMIDINPLDGGYALVGTGIQREWILGSVQVSKQTFQYKEGTYPFLELTFLLERHDGLSSATVFIPALVLTVLTLISFWLEPLGSNRFTVCCMNVLVHCLYLQYLGEKLPSNGDSCPIIVLFYRDSLLLAGISLMVAVLVRGLTRAPDVVPICISSTVSWILGSKPGQLLLMRELSNPKEETSATDVGAEGKPELIKSAQIKPEFQWQLFALLLDRLFFLLFLPTYVILMWSFIP